MLSAAQQMLRDSRTKIELLRMQIVKVSQARDGEEDGKYGKSYHSHMYCSCMGSVFTADILYWQFVFSMFQ